MSEVLIIGGGISGLLTARELRLAGLEVSVLERGELGRESSWAGGGIVSPLYPWRYPDPVNHLASWSQAHYSALAEEIHERSGLDPEYQRSGLLMPAPEEPLDEIYAWAARFDKSLVTLSPDQVAGLEPAMIAPEGEALWMAEIGQVRNPRFIKALVQELKLLGVTLRTGVEVRAPELVGGRVVGVDSSDGRLAADRVLIAGGAWSSALLASLPEEVRLDLAVEPVRGQMLLYKAEPGLLQHIVLSGAHYLIPRRDGHILVGSTVERVGFDKSTTETALQELQAIAFGLVPALAGFPLAKQWAGLRPGCDDGVPRIGAVPGVEGLFVNCGHYRNGVVLGPASARLAADIMLGRPPAVAPEPYRLERLMST